MPVKNKQNKTKTHLRMSELQSTFQYCFAATIRSDLLKTALNHHKIEHPQEVAYLLSLQHKLVMAP